MSKTKPNINFECHERSLLGRREKRLDLKSGPQLQLTESLRLITQRLRPSQALKPLGDMCHNIYKDRKNG